MFSRGNTNCYIKVRSDAMWAVDMRMDMRETIASSLATVQQRPADTDGEQPEG